MERAFSASLERIRANPTHRLWGDRVMISRERAVIVGSVVFHGGPDAQGEVEIAYGVEGESQGQGYATEGTRAALDWAIQQPEVSVVRAITPPFHHASQRVLEKIGMQRLGTIPHDMFGEVLEYEKRRP
ncbi:MAG: GNAT family N-acetyltransferase [Tetrasphaera sp.]